MLSVGCMCSRKTVFYNKTTQFLTTNLCKLPYRTLFSFPSANSYKPYLSPKHYSRTRPVVIHHQVVNSYTCKTNYSTKCQNDSDFFGIITNGHEPESESSNENIKAMNVESLNKKYSFLRKSRHKKETLVEAPFGTVRIDNQNLLNSLKEDEALHEITSKLYRTKQSTSGINKRNSEKSLYDTPVIESVFIDPRPNKRINEQYLTELMSEQNKANDSSGPENGSHIFDEQYFSDNVSTETKINTTRVSLDETNADLELAQTVNVKQRVNVKGVKEMSSNTSEALEDNIHQNPDRSHNEFDEQYFSERLINDRSNKLDVNLEVSEYRSENSISSKGNIEPSNYFDEKYFSATSDNLIQTDLSNKNKDGVYSRPELKAADGFDKLHHTSVHSTEAEIANDHPTLEDDHLDKPENFGGMVTKQIKRLRNRQKPNIEEPQTAYDYAMKIRKEMKMKQNEQEVGEPEVKPFTGKWSGKVDRKGFKILQGQVLDFTYQQEDVVTQILKNSIIYDEGGIIAIDKPYGLPSHGGPGVHHSVGKLLPKLAKLVDKNLETLHLVHRLDKETTGVMMLAKDEETADRLHGMFVRREVVKRYWVLTKGVPHPLEGVIDIPMAEGTVTGKYRMSLRPVRTEVTRPWIGKHSKSYDAVTKYEVLDDNNMCALVELEPATGVKHQIRCHLAFGMNTPVLGDHKYSHFSKIAPQKLHPTALQRLGIRQAKVRHLPMHLHAKSIVLPHYLDGRNLFISTRLPSHFVQNMKWLKLKPPPGK